MYRDMADQKFRGSAPFPCQVNPVDVSFCLTIIVGQQYGTNRLTVHNAVSGIANSFLHLSQLQADLCTGRAASGLSS